MLWPQRGANEAPCPDDFLPACVVSLRAACHAHLSGANPDLLGSVCTGCWWTTAHARGCRHAGVVLCEWSNPARGGVMWRGNSGALLRVCRVHRSVSPLRELREALAAVSGT